MQLLFFKHALEKNRGLKYVVALYTIEVIAKGIGLPENQDVVKYYAYDEFTKIDNAVLID